MLLTGLVAGLIGLLIGAVVTAEGARRTGELSLDVTLSEHRDTLLRDVGLAVQTGFGPLVAPLILLVVCGVVWWRVDLTTAAVVALLAIPGWFSVEVGKVLYHRARPPAGVVHSLVHETQHDSFPSGHVAFTAALVLAVAVALHEYPVARRWVLGGGGLLVVVVAASRLVVGAHYLGDVVAAPFFAVGTILVLVAVGAAVPVLLATRLTRDT